MSDFSSPNALATPEFAPKTGNENIPERVSNFDQFAAWIGAKNDRNQRHTFVVCSLTCFELWG
jgi:hypothetical protein